MAIPGHVRLLRSHICAHLLLPAPFRKNGKCGILSLLQVDFPVVIPLRAELSFGQAVKTAPLAGRLRTDGEAENDTTTSGAVGDNVHPLVVDVLARVEHMRQLHEEHSAAEQACQGSTGDPSLLSTRDRLLADLSAFALNAQSVSASASADRST